MSSISSITKAVSGLKAAQTGLQVTAHNIANTGTEGYTREHVLQSDSGYLSIGNNGGYKMQVGLGVNSDEIRQIRDQLADRRFRTENSVLSYYQKLNGTIEDISAMFDEPYGDTISKLLNTFWSQAQKLNTNPSGVEERKSFISTAKVLASKINVINDSLETYQAKLNNDLVAGVERVNEILTDIARLNEIISVEELSGANANDYRDVRNNLLDELSTYGEVSYFEQKNKQLTVSFEGHVAVDKQMVTKMELRDTNNSRFKDVIWKDSETPVFNLNKPVSSIKQEDSGSLKAILIARGRDVVQDSTTWDDVALNKNMSVDIEGNAFLIPKIQMMLNDFTNELTTLVNRNFKGNGIGSAKGQSGVPVFIAKEVPDALKEVKEKIANGTDIIKDPVTGALIDQIDPTLRMKYNEYLVAGNVIVNPALLEDGGYNKLGTVSKDGSDDNVGDNTLIEKFLNEFGETKTWYQGADPSAPTEKTSKLVDFFSELVTDIGAQGSFFTNKANEKNISVTNIKNERQAIGGVSTDEEFTSMLRYQYAYNASARMITMLDGMLDTIINKL